MEIPRCPGITKLPLVFHLFSVAFCLFTVPATVYSMRANGPMYIYLSADPIDTNSNRHSPDSSNQDSAAAEEAEEAEEDDDDSTRDLFTFSSYNTPLLLNEIILLSEVYAAAQPDITTPPPWG